MKAMSLWAPWAHLCVLGAKQFETRSRATSYRGEIAIHAAKRWEKDQYDLCLEEPFRSVLRAAGYLRARSNYVDVVEVPLGCVVGVVTLHDCWPTRLAGDARHRIPPQEDAFGNFAPGRYAYTLVNPRRIEPVPCRGQQTVPFVLEPGVASQVLDRLQACHI